MRPKRFGSLSMNIAPVSSRTVGILPLRRAVKNVSGTHVKVCHDVENLKYIFYIKWLIYWLIYMYTKNVKDCSDGEEMQ